MKTIKLLTLFLTFAVIQTTSAQKIVEFSQYKIEKDEYDKPTLIIKPHTRVGKADENYEELCFEYFEEGLALVSVLKEDGSLKFGFIDRTGKEVIPLKVDDANEFNEGKAEVEIDYDSFFF